ncbi:hypothetical protein NUU61_003132 [Penicillium alfredii]|uniref:BTB domain-containing protein n=1 Tax=Penicillium alfredii TaxID=1506179 RepID=A0A9W9FTI3_9EURO|nr:uncharacterized protein NUU61_003132 [Penicillium alfredii]KAJ5105785.1 hypothetical protein NUU61_003132 [Penicillium alfredii]
MALSAFQATMKDLLANGKYSDMVISSQGRDFAVHRAVVCSQSTFFDAAMKGGFKEGATSRIELLEDDPEIIERVLNFCYLQDESMYPGGYIVDFSDLETLIRTQLAVWVAADKFHIPALQKLARSRLLVYLRNYEARDIEDLVGVLRNIRRSILPQDDGFLECITGIILFRTRIFLNTDTGVEFLNEEPELAVTALRVVVEERDRLAPGNVNLKRRVVKEPEH